jgi:hypothetical protein
VRDIGASVEVRALIGADKLRELHGDAFARYECWRCGRTGRTTEPTSVIVTCYRVFQAVKLAHAGCADSHIIEVGAAGMRAVTGQTAALQHGQQIRGAGRQSRSGEAPGTGMRGIQTT